MSKLTVEQLKTELERAATSLLSDAEILKSLNITQSTLNKHYSTVETARLKLKQRLNAKRISDAAQGNGKIDAVLNAIPVNNKEKQKGKTNNPNGRPKGTSNKISGATILASVEKYAGEKFEDLLAQGYVEAIQQRDKVARMKYEQMFLNKVVADKNHIDINSEHMVDEIFQRLTIKGPDHDQE
jgi:DNA-binding CsgD family transcriptional regulator